MTAQPKNDISDTAQALAVSLAKFGILCGFTTLVCGGAAKTGKVAEIGKLAINTGASIALAKASKDLIFGRQPLNGKDR